MEIRRKVLTSSTTVKQIISNRRKDESGCKMYKNENTRAKRAKLLFFVVNVQVLVRVNVVLAQASKRPCPRHACVLNVTRVE